MYKDPKQMSVC